MKVFVSKYNLTPKQKLNALDHIEIKEGLYIKVVDRGETFYGDYFAHLALNDLAADDVLNDPFSNQYFLNAIELASYSLTHVEFKTFLNHKLNSVGKVSKFKILSHQSFKQYEDNIRNCERVRLDMNGTFSIQELNSIIKQFNFTNIEYIEDPSHEAHWHELIVDSASDFIENDRARYRIIKPNKSATFKPHQDIISSYMGSDWGRFLCYLYLMRFGDLNLYHGIHTPNLYENQLEMFELIDQNELRFQLKLDDLEILKNELNDRKWYAL